MRKKFVFLNTNVVYFLIQECHSRSPCSKPQRCYYRLIKNPERNSLRTDISRNSQAHLIIKGLSKDEGSADNKMRKLPSFAPSFTQLPFLWSISAIAAPLAMTRTVWKPQPKKFKFPKWIPDRRRKESDWTGLFVGTNLQRAVVRRDTFTFVLFGYKWIE